MLKDLAIALEDCAPVTRGQIEKIFKGFAANGAFEIQLDQFITLAKERALEEAIYELFPKMRDPGYGTSTWTPINMQFPHVKTGFLKVYEDLIGLNIKGASEDPNRNEKVAHQKRDQFLKVFYNKIEIYKIIKDFVIAINTENNATIQNIDFFEWCGEHGLGGEVMYDEDTIYPRYFSKPSKDQVSMLRAYVKEETAIEVFKTLKYIQS